MTAPPTGLQMDLLTVVLRLRQYRDELAAGRDGFAWWLMDARILGCDLPRLEGHLTAETRDWAATSVPELQVPGRPWTVLDLARVTRIPRSTIYREIARGCLDARPGRPATVGIEAAEVDRWRLAYLTDPGNHEEHRGSIRDKADYLGTEKRT